MECFLDLHVRWLALSMFVLNRALGPFFAWGRLFHFCHKWRFLCRASRPKFSIWRYRPSGSSLSYRWRGANARLGDVFFLQIWVAWFVVWCVWSDGSGGVARFFLIPWAFLKTIVWWCAMKNNQRILSLEWLFVKKAMPEQQRQLWPMTYQWYNETLDSLTYHHRLSL